MSFITRLLAGTLLACVVVWSPAWGQYNRNPESDIDTTIFTIDESKFLGVKVDGDYRLVDEGGGEFALSEMLGKPLILVLSYYTCDGSCSLINRILNDLLEGVGRSTLGEDFRILTLSFDKNETTKSLRLFRKELELPAEMKNGWTFATFKDPVEIKPFTDKIGYKFFWSPRDRTFFHPGVFLFLSAEGRLARVLYALNVESNDVDLAILDARQGRFRPGEVLEYVASLCYSYNYKEGRYTYNIPLFVAVGSLTLGVSVFTSALLVYRRWRMKERVG